MTGRNHYDRAIALYNPAEHRALASRFGQDVGVVILSLRSWVLWLLGYPEAAQQDTKHALANAREVGQATTLMYALWAVGWTHLQRGDYTEAKSVSDECVALSDQKGALFWKLVRNVASRRHPSRDWKGVRGNSLAQLCPRHCLVNRNHGVDADALIAFSQGAF